MAHNLIYYDTSNNTIQQFSTAELDLLAERILRTMAAGTYTGTITIGSTNSIGTFTDTALVGAAGSTDTSTVSNTYTLSQVTTATLGASSDPPMYIGLDTTDPTTTVLQENLTTVEQLADEILSRMVVSTGGTNAYYLAPSAPADGATWVSRGTLLDTITNLTVTVTDYKLWHRTTSGATITNKDPVKLSSGNIQTFSDAEIDAIIKIVEQRIVATGIGTYALQESAPGTGTWTNVGTVTDTRENITTSSYLGPASYTNENAVNYTATYLGTRDYAGDVAYSTSYTSTQSFTNPDAIAYTATYLGPATYTTPAVVFSPNYPFTAVFYGPSFQSFFTPVGYVNETTYPGFNITYANAFIAGQFSATYQGPGTFLRSYVGPTGTFNRSYLGNDAVPFNSPNYNRSYTGAFFTPNYYGPTTFTGTVAYNRTLGPGIYEGTTFFGPLAIPTFASFTNPDALSFSTTNYLGSQSFISPFNTFTSDYLGEVNFTSAETEFDGTNYSGSQTYDSEANFDVSVVAPTTSTISTRTLWRRVA